MLSKATKRLYFLKLLKRAGVPCAQLQQLCGSNPANLRIRGPSLASFTHELSERSDRRHTKIELLILFTVLLMACHTLTPFSLPVSVASEHAENIASGTQLF